MTVWWDCELFKSPGDQIACGESTLRPSILRWNILRWNRQGDWLACDQIGRADTSDSGDSSFLNETGDSEFYHNDESDASSSEFDSPVTENGKDSYDDTDEDSDDFNDF